MSKFVKRLFSLLTWNARHNQKQSFFAILVVLSMVAGVLLSFPSYAQLATQTQELRGVWLTNVDSNVLFDRYRLKQALQRLDELNFNIVYPTVWNWGWTLYPSKVAQKVIGRAVDPEPGLQKRDMLKEVVEEGHKRGLSVIPWFEFGFMAPADSDLAKRTEKWLTSRRDGTKIWKEGKHDRVWLNPFRPEVQDFIQDLVIELVKNYDIDGIQFDDHFGLPAEMGYDEFTVNLYKQEHNGQAPSDNPQDPEWVKWRADKITDYVEKVFREIKKVKEKCIFSVAPNPQRFSYEFYLADWETWERKGYIEELVIQLYRNDLNVFISELERPEVKTARSHIPVSIGILSGLKDRYVPMQQVERQVGEVRKRNFAGVSFFFYETLWNIAQEKPFQRQFIFRRMFPKEVATPNLQINWKK